MLDNNTLDKENYRAKLIYYIASKLTDINKNKPLNQSLTMFSMDKLLSDKK